MSFQSWLLWPDNVPLSMLVLIVVGMAFLYVARRPMHELLRSLGQMVGGPLRMAARWLAAAAAEINHRNKAVLLAHGRQEVGQRVEREFERLGAIVTRDLQGYPTLQRKLLDEITRIEEDYKKCGEVPPPPPDWTDAVAAVANVKSAGNELVLRVLEEIKRSVTGIHDKAIGDTARPTRRATGSSEASCRSGARSTRTSPRSRRTWRACSRASPPSMRTWRSTSRSTPAPTRRSTRSPSRPSRSSPSRSWSWRSRPAAPSSTSS